MTAADRDGSLETSAQRDRGGAPWRLGLAAATLALVAFAITWTYLEPPAPDRLRLATGSADGAYFSYGEHYARLLAEHDVALEVIQTAGSAENLELLQAGEVDLALVQGGLGDPVRHPDVEALASILFEPVWLFHRVDLEVERLTDLAGARVAIGRPGSGTRELARVLLADNGLSPEKEGISAARGGADVGDAADAGESDPRTEPSSAPEAEPTIEVREIGGRAAAEALQMSTVDAAFFVSSPEAGHLRELLADPAIRLMSFERSRAYHVRHRYLSDVLLGEGVVDLQTNLPDRDVTMVAAAAALAARSDLHHAIVPLVIEAAQDVHGNGGFFDEPGTFPSSQWLGLPLGTEAEHYLERGPSFLFRVLPYRTAVSVDRLKIFLLPFIPLLLMLFKAAPPIYRWRIRSKIYRWYEDLRELDQFVASQPSPEEARAKLPTVERLEQEVTDVSVPLSYMDEFYNLRVHIDLIETKLEALLEGDD
ncbi:MAG: TAXI family TRAP transporter solute-binding subunit [Acidobacteriota bacterium]